MNNGKLNKLFRLYSIPVAVLLIVPLVFEKMLGFFHISGGTIESLIGFFAISLFYIFMQIKENDIIDQFITIFDETVLERLYLYIHLINALIVSLAGLMFKSLKFFPSTVRAYTFFCALSFVYTLIYLARQYFFDDEEQDRTFRVILRIGEILLLLGIYFTS